MPVTRTLLALCIAAAAAGAIADDAHHPDQKPQAAPPKAARGAPSMGMGAMQGNMKRMQEQMAQIRAASDPKERERLLDEHAKTMQQSMSMMQAMMEQHMGMMKMMMNQMIEHDSAGRAAPKP